MQGDLIYIAVYMYILGDKEFAYCRVFVYKCRFVNVEMYYHCVYENTCTQMKCVYFYHHV